LNGKFFLYRLSITTILELLVWLWID